MFEWQSTEIRPAKEQDFHAELSRPGEGMDPRALLWRCTVKEAPPETRLVSGKVDLKSLRSISAPPQHSKDKYHILFSPCSLLYKQSFLSHMISSRLVAYVYVAKYVI